MQLLISNTCWGEETRGNRSDNRREFIGWKRSEELPRFVGGLPRPGGERVYAAARRAVRLPIFKFCLSHPEAMSVSDSWHTAYQQVSENLASHAYGGPRDTCFALNNILKYKPIYRGSGRIFVNAIFSRTELRRFHNFLAKPRSGVCHL
jgi:hypothetical protein